MTDLPDTTAFQLTLGALTQILFQLPALIVAVIGIVLGFRNMGKHPNTSRAAITAFSLVIVMTVIFAFTNIFLPYVVYENTESFEAIGWYNAAVSFVGSIINAVTYVLIVMAIFKWRGAEQSATPAREIPRPYDVASNQYNTETRPQS